MTHYTYPISIEKEDGQYYAYSEALPGVYGTGDSIEEAKDSMLESIRLYILECRKDGKPIPVARTIYSETVSIAVE
ncbi:MAG TPA: type II toxin-antitoxin system HicB family antitoxin [Candidatus Acidoferrum sp.]|nr:type II toxin-antitoxin system HicB family antitoxin [Candidatus Acidoferrum sp.]